MGDNVKHDQFQTTEDWVALLDSASLEFGNPKSAAQACELAGFPLEHFLALVEAAGINDVLDAISIMPNAPQLQETLRLYSHTFFCLGILAARRKQQRKVN